MGSFGFNIRDLAPPGRGRLCILIVKRSTHTSRFSVGNCREGAAPLLRRARGLIDFESMLSATGVAIETLPLLLDHTAPRSPRVTCRRGALPRTFGRYNFSAT